MQRTTTDIRRITGVLAGLAILVTASCSSPTPEENAEQACTAADEFAVALDNYENVLTPEATVDEVQSARDELDNARETLDDATSEVAQDRVDTLDQEWDNLEEGIDDIGGDETLADAASSLKGDAAAVAQARDALVADLDC